MVTIIFSLTVFYSFYQAGFKIEKVLTNFSFSKNLTLLSKESYRKVKVRCEIRFFKIIKLKIKSLKNQRHENNENWKVKSLTLSSSMQAKM
ncbi:MAG: hypothetical protein HGGPFJEG_00101 [Ignavibacteria bacterium]|nr:hypothetical protein [Ignavibacteria bacterium]